jgi:DNA-binding XRE family transcriptional regulator
MEVTMNYQRLVKELREKLILTQQEFANLLGVSFASINRWETGRHEPTIKVKRKIVELCKENNIDLEGKNNVSF